MGFCSHWVFVFCYSCAPLLHELRQTGDSPEKSACRCSDFLFKCNINMTGYLLYRKLLSFVLYQTDLFRMLCFCYRLEASCGRSAKWVWRPWLTSPCQNRNAFYSFPCSKFEQQRRPRVLPDSCRQRRLPSVEGTPNITIRFWQGFCFLSDTMELPRD